MRLIFLFFALLLPSVVHTTCFVEKWKEMDCMGLEMKMELGNTGFSFHCADTEVSIASQTLQMFYFYLIIVISHTIFKL